MVSSGRRGGGSSRTPAGSVNLGSGRTAKTVSCGKDYTCAILDDDTLKCWGKAESGLLGYGDTYKEMPRATAVVNLAPGAPKAVACGEYHTCAILDDDTLKCWGRILYRIRRRQWFTAPRRRR